MKKGQGLPLNTIVIAIIAIVVLVVLIAMFSSKIFSFNEDISGCEEKGGSCVADKECDKTKSTSLLGEGCTEGKICCIKIL